jgi:ribosomal protein S18 acetylase RimI-like enzyme
VELTLDVAIDNERAVAFYEKLGFTTYRRRMLVDVDTL